MKISVLDHGFVRLIDSMPRDQSHEGDSSFDENWGPGDQRIVDAARVSIAGQGVRPVSDNKKLVHYMLKHHHTSVFEKVNFEFHVKLPIFVARQWMRHRTWSYNEMSARYGVMPDEFYVPALDRMQAQAKQNKQGSGDTLPEADAFAAQELIKRSNTEAYQSYERLLNGGLARELARMVLPVNLYTQFFATVDLNNLMRFLRLRLDEHAQYEIRVYAEAMLELARVVAPCAISAFENSLGGEDE